MPTKAALKRAQQKLAYQKKKQQAKHDTTQVSGSSTFVKRSKHEKTKKRLNQEESIVLSPDENIASSINQEANPRIVANLYQADFDTIMNPQGYLNDVHMENFLRIVSLQSNFRPQQTYNFQNPDLIVPIDEGHPHVQILFQQGFNGGIGHWITTFYDGEKLNIYNSTHTMVLHPDAETYLTRLFPFTPPVNFVNVQQQNNLYDCGLYAIANTASVVLNKKPEDQLYDVSQLRSHTAEILRTEQISAFPTVNRQMQLQANYLKRKSLESLDDKESRLKNVKNDQKIRLLNESIEEKEKRLKRDKQYQNSKRQEKSHEEKQKRLHTQSISRKQRIQNESLDEKIKRLETKKANKQRNLSKETPAEKRQRLQAECDSKKEAAKKKKLLVKPTSKSTFMLATKGLEEEVQLHTLGKMDVVCGNCGSKNFLFERSTDSKFTHCCRKGRLQPDEIKDYPKYLQDLLTRNDKDSCNFRENIRSYNSAFAFASMGAQIDQLPGKGPYVFRIHGQIYHSTSSMYPAQGDTEKYAQLYIIDTVDALAKRMSLDCNKKCRATVMKKTDELLRAINPYCAAYMMLKEVEEREKAKAAATNTVLPDINLWICSDRKKDIRRYNLPTCNEVAVVFSSTDGEPPVDRDICIHPRGQASIPIEQYSENCDPMTYPILFPRGEAGWSIKMKIADKKVTPLQFYTNRLADRKYFNPCLHAGKLTQQFIVDAYVKVESERLTFIKQNQFALRVELYSGLMDHINNLAANEGAKAGTMMILPSTFQGGSRFMQKMYQNAMAIVREFGKPDLFITATCNPKWTEICDQLLNGETASDRPDIVARVFQGKIKSMLKEFLEDNIFGVVVAYIYVIEFQKRGLPHMHLLLILREQDKIRNKDQIDAIVCAEIPDITKEPELYQIVKTNMVHGPCGTALNPNSPCMRDNKCTKKYPKQYREETFENLNGYPLYRRRYNNVKMDILWPNGTVKYTVDNRWIVPYNPYLSKKYKAHINVEICSSVKSIKYICDYLCKGHDCASVKLGQADSSKVVQWNEITGYLDARYVSAPESCWRLWEYPLHDKSHAIFQLAVHLKHQQAVVFQNGNERKAIERAAKKETTLTAWFLLNCTDTSAHQYHYTDIPVHYVFTSEHVWQKRQRTNKPPIGRMISVTPKDIERFHLRLLLVHALGAKSYEDLRTVDGTTYATFQQAARAKGLLASDDECEKCLEEAAVLHKFPRELRELFAFILSFNPTCNALMLWEKFKSDLIEDYLRHYSNDVAVNKGLRDIQIILLLQGLQLSQFGLPEPVADTADGVIDLNEKIDVNAEKIEGANNLALFNTQQKEVYELVMKAVTDDKCAQRYFFVDGPGGTGKTFLYNTIISALRGEEKTVLAVAWTGIAATLLKGGRTAHSTFKLPVPVNETSVCKVKGTSAAGKTIKNSSLIIWDEVTMAPKYALKAMDTLLKDIMNTGRPFGGKVVVLGGDFRQCLPIVPYTNHRTTIIETSMLRSTLWPLFKKFSLTENMRVNPNEQEFSKYLLTVGNGICGDEEDMATIPKRCLVTGSLADEIFGTSVIAPDDIYNYINRAILCPKNDQTMTMNDVVLEKLAGQARVYYSADSAECEDNNKICPPTEFLNKHTPTGMPPHKLTLKVGAIVMLLRNMNPKRGLCNGTRLIVKEMMHNYLDLEIVTGQSKGERVFLPRIDLKPVDSEMPFILKRRQFPIRLAFSMTINKSQGQTFDRVGVNLEKPVFTHGQLYVAMSRVRSFDSLLIKLPEDSENESGESISTNIVFKEILN